MTETPSTPTARKAARYWPWVSGAVLISMAVALGLIIAVRQNAPFLIDGLWMDLMFRSRTTWLDTPALFLNFLGGGWFAITVVPLGTVLALYVMRKRWAALYYALAVLASVAAVQVLKVVLGRQRPEQILVVSDAGSFPSGHVANAATFTVVLALILARSWVWYVGALYTLAMALSRTYLGAHWLSDTFGGAILGVGIAVIVWAPLAARLNRERHRLPDGLSVNGQGPA